MSQPMDVLLNTVKTQMIKFDKKRNKYRRNLILSKIISAALTALITVLLGLTFGLTEIEIWLKNVALVISAFLTVLTTLDALYDFQSRHVSNHIAYKRLQELEFELELYIAANPEREVEPSTLAKFKGIYLAILKDDLDEWIKDRKQPLENSQLHT